MSVPSPVQTCSYCISSAILYAEEVQKFVKKLNEFGRSYEVCIALPKIRVAGWRPSTR